MSKSSDLQFRYYQQVKAVVLSGKPDAPSYIEWEDYGADVSAYDSWSDAPEKWERAEGDRARLPLSSDRRAHLKELGFAFKRDGVVTYKGVPAEEYVGHEI